MKKVFLIGHTGSINRGCEAIVRSTLKLLNNEGIYEIYLVAYDNEHDGRLGVDKLCYYTPYKQMKRLDPNRMIGGIFKKAFKSAGMLEKKKMQHILDIIEPGDIALFIGGDTYCYGKPLHLYAQHKLIKKKGAITILWSCSLEEQLMDKDMLKDMVLYDYIMPREQISYNNLLNKGISPDKLVHMSDVAFNLNAKSVKEYGGVKNTVGVNFSPIVMRNNKAYQSILALIKYILSETDMSILLIPHVYDADAQDAGINNMILKSLAKNERIAAVNGFYSCEELKYIISQCRFFIGARTHATIAAYSSGVPTLVLGYSVKSRGIACDIFGTENGYAIMYDTVEDENVLIKAFSAMMEKEEDIREIYKRTMPQYKALGINAAKQIKKLYGETPKRNNVYYSALSCCGCGACAQKCPKNCIEMRADKYGFKYPVIDMKQCIGCNLCRSVCPVTNKLDTGEIKKVYAAYSNDAQLRNNSSSGGLFGELARTFLANGGVVFGAGFDETFIVVHKYVENTEDLPQLCRSKYVQSDLRDSYERAQAFLKDGRKVLFSGTPCQIGGLKKYLAIDYDNLFTVDIICHGVPAPGAWERYKAARIRQVNSHIKNVNFRDKTEGWQLYSMKIEFQNNNIYLKNSKADSYLKSFITNSTLRESCSSCAFKGLRGVSDITLADFWGIKSQLNDAEYTSDKGTSAVIIRSGKGQALFDKCYGYTAKEMTVESVLKSNPSLIKSVKLSPLRKKFLDEMLKKNYDEVTQRYYGKGLAAKVRRFIAQIELVCIKLRNRDFRYLLDRIKKVERIEK